MSAQEAESISKASKASKGSKVKDEADLAAEIREERIVACIQAMMPAAPDIIRAVPAAHALHGFGRAFRTKTLGKDVYDRSEVVSRIGAFWSHSWHGNKWMKIFTLLFLKNGLPAAILSSLGAMIAAVLYAARLLPGFGEARACWCSIAGFLIWLLTILWYQPREKIFVDVLCVDQRSRTRKALGIVSIGAFLASSDQMLVLWDPTYTRRLWCIFELAAYLRSREDASDANLIIRPTICGPCYVMQTCAFCAFFVSAGFVNNRDRAFVLVPLQALAIVVCFYATVAAFRSYFRSLHTLEHDLADFRLAQTSSYCCESKHKKGQICDRQVVEKCIRYWFGDIETFEDVVRNDVSAYLTEQLRSDFFSYRMCLTTIVPTLWAYVDAAAHPYHYRFTEPPAHEEALWALIRLAAWGLGVTPFIYLAGVKMAHFFYADYGRCCNVLVNLLIVFILALYFAAATQLETLWYWIMDRYVDECCRTRYLPMIWNAAVVVPITISLYYCVGVPLRIGKKPGDPVESPVDLSVPDEHEVLPTPLGVSLHNKV